MRPPRRTRSTSMENEIKIVLDRVSPSLVKVVAENARKYVATGIALEDELVITTSLITRHPFEKISVEDIKGETIAAIIVGQDNRSGLTLLRLDKKGPRLCRRPAGRGRQLGGAGRLVLRPLSRHLPGHHQQPSAKTN